MTIESLLPTVPLQIRMNLFRELLSAELEARLSRDEEPNIGEYQARFPDDAAEILRAFAETEKLVASSNASVQILQTGQSNSVIRSQTEVLVAPDEGGVLERTASSVSKEIVQQLPRNIGKYRIEQIIGQGAFGVVYRAYVNN